MTLTIEALRGVWRCQLDSRTHFADTLEELLLKIAPNAPEEYVWHAAEVLGAILGAEVVEVPRDLDDMNDDDLARFFAALDGGGMSAEQWGEALGQQYVEGHRVKSVDSWQPTDEQRAYFENERTEEVDQFVVEDDGA